MKMKDTEGLINHKSESDDVKKLEDKLDGVIRVISSNHASVYTKLRWTIVTTLITLATFFFLAFNFLTGFVQRGELEKQINHNRHLIEIYTEANKKAIEANKQVIGEVNQEVKNRAEIFYSLNSRFESIDMRLKKMENSIFSIERYLFKGEVRKR